jgi:hypothetical protein
MAKTFPAGSPTWILITGEVGHLARFPSYSPGPRPPRPSADFVSVPKLEADGLSPGAYGIIRSGQFVESLGPLSRRDLTIMRELLSSAEAIDRETVVENIEAILAQRLGTEVAGIEPARVPKLLFANVCAGCPSGQTLDAAVSDASVRDTALAVFIPDSYKALLRELQGVDGIYALGYGQDQEALSDLLIAGRLLGINYPLTIHPSEDQGP